LFAFKILVKQNCLHKNKDFRDGHFSGMDVNWKHRNFLCLIWPVLPVTTARFQWKISSAVFCQLDDSRTNSVSKDS